MDTWYDSRGVYLPRVVKQQISESDADEYRIAYRTCASSMTLDNRYMRLLALKTVVSNNKKNKNKKKKRSNAKKGRITKTLEKKESEQKVLTTEEISKSAAEPVEKETEPMALLVQELPEPDAEPVEKEA